MMAHPVFLPTINLGAILQALTVILTVGGSVFAAGQWAASLRDDLRQETQARLQQEAALAHDLSEKTAALAKDLAGQVANETRKRNEQTAMLADQQQAVIATLARIDKSFQHLFAAVQPQPRRN